MMYENGLAAYRDTAVQTSSPTKLVIMLYEGSVRFLRESVAAVRSVDHAAAVVEHRDVGEAVRVPELLLGDLPQRVAGAHGVRRPGRHRGLLLEPGPCRAPGVAVRAAVRLRRDG